MTGIPMPTFIQEACEIEVNCPKTENIVKTRKKKVRPAYNL
jgi:hypothetical protein